ncbi:type II toxin-antitoxin system YafQ family toxin [Candidatus Synechococcus calcipolaris G9]|uniref:Type II toxin-antitoxin system YafQ family toxin n=1 Tax=Candidatus Synechococcus calcipolaris G9 TaxID=1497997 RepID=A0ABT6EYK7_9SYNE|nr:type II toxin-antitoxin system YafQ family toxin [Candidatus Synechococcus calcipolaris]MDG2990653.1 type II toxin-antitoxin system YafQ family toxin [Candidatus Synechococcus calcipolaris G9]
MREEKITSQFKKDARAAKARGKDMAKLASVIKKLQADEPLDSRYKDHVLLGGWKPKRECHIEPDWLLIYDTSQPGLLILVRTGSHSDLFEKTKRKKK